MKDAKKPDVGENGIEKEKAHANGEESQDSVSSKISTKSDLSSASSGDGKADGLVETVKDEEGGEFMITLNTEEDDNKEEDNKMEIEVEESTKDKVENNAVKPAAASEVKSAPLLVKPPTLQSKPQEVVKTSLAYVSPPPLTPAPGVLVSSAPAAVLVSSSALGTPGLALPTASLQMLSSTQLSLPGGATVVQSGNQYGYITKMGGQTLFVPLIGNAFSAQIGRAHV